MYDGLKILDVDRHVMEPVPMWREYLPQSLAEYAPELASMSPAGETLTGRLERLGDQALLPTPPIVAVKGKPIWRGVTEAGYIEVGLHAQSHRAELLAAETGPGQLRSMDATGVDVAVLLPTYGGYLVYDDEIDAPLSRAYAQAYNRWLLDTCRSAPARLKSAAIVSRHDPSRMVADLEDALRDGTRAVVMRPNPIGGRTLGHPAHAAFWDACEQNSVTVLFHEGAHTRTETAGANRFESHFAQHACSHPMEAMMAFLALLEAGVFERHPRLRVAFLEAGCGWLPYWLWRLDELEYAQLSNELGGKVARRPSEYFRSQCWVAFEPGEALLAESAAAIGEDRLVFGTDFPHVDHDAGIVSELFGTSARLPRPALEAALWDNAARLLGLSPAELAIPGTGPGTARAAV